VLKILAYLDTTSSICVLTRLDNPQAFTEFGEIVENSFLSWILTVDEQLFKFMVLGIIKSFFDVEGEWQEVVVFLSNSLIVDFHIIEYGLFVA